MASAWICHESVEYPPESTIATGMTPLANQCGRPADRVRLSQIGAASRASGSSTNGSEPAL